MRALTPEGGSTVKLKRYDIVSFGSVQNSDDIVIDAAP